MRDINLDSALSNIEKPMTIKSIDGCTIKKVKRAGGFKGAMLNVESGGNLTLENITFDGGYEEDNKGNKTANAIEATASILKINEGASATLGDKATLQNNYNSAGKKSKGGGVDVSSDGTFNLSGNAQIFENTLGEEKMQQPTMYTYLTARQSL